MSKKPDPKIISREELERLYPNYFRPDHPSSLMERLLFSLRKAYEVIEQLKDENLGLSLLEQDAQEYLASAEYDCNANCTRHSWHPSKEEG